MKRLFTAIAISMALSTPAMAKHNEQITTPKGSVIVAVLLPDATCYADHLTAYVGPPDSKFSVSDKGAGDFEVSFSGSALADPATKKLGWKPGGTCGNENSLNNHLIMTSPHLQSADFSIRINPNGVFHGSALFHE